MSNSYDEDTLTSKLILEDKLMGKKANNFVKLCMKQGALEELNLFKEWLLKDAIPLHMDKPLVILADNSKLQCEENYISDNSIIEKLERRIKELKGVEKQ